MNAMNIPGFTADASIFQPVRNYRTVTSGASSGISPLVMPQARASIGGFGRLSLAPSPPRCSRCQEDAPLSRADLAVERRGVTMRA